VTASDVKWRVGPDGFKLENLRLASLWTSGGDLWHASVTVLNVVDFEAWAKVGTIPDDAQAAASTIPSSTTDALEHFDADKFGDMWDGFDFNTEFGMLQ
jgi:hypothetical protein